MTNFLLSILGEKQPWKKQLTVDQFESKKNLSKIYCTSRSNRINKKQQCILKITVSKRGEMEGYPNEKTTKQQTAK
jgi:hypothetical protein